MVKVHDDEALASGDLVVVTTSASPSSIVDTSTSTSVVTTAMSNAAANGKSGSDVMQPPQQPSSSSRATQQSTGGRVSKYRSQVHSMPPYTLSMPSFPHFHYHWSYPDPAVVVPQGGSEPATFHFGPGFEHQLPRPFTPASVVNGTASGQPVGAAATASSSSSTVPPEHVVHFHVNPGVTVSFKIGDSMELIQGPMTVPMVSTNSSPPIAMPVQVPPGHVVQQVVDENGTLRHVILSPQPPIVPMGPPPGHNPPHYGPGPGNGSSHQPPPPPFYSPQALPPGYGPPHFGMPTGGHLGHPPPPGSHTGHSPPPNFHKDERTQRQYNKLKRKLEQKQMRGNGDTLIGATINSGHSTPSTLSPRKDLTNGLKRGVAHYGMNSKERGMSSVGTSEDGEESSSVQEDEDELHLTDILSSVQAPQKSELSSRSALIEWFIPQRMSEAASSGSHDLDISESDLRYEVLLSTDKGKEGKYKSIYSGTSLSCRIQDLRPGQEYSVRVQVHWHEFQGNASEPLTFTTPPCEPDAPQPPKLISRNRTSLQLRWNAATDNGSHITNYILEYDAGQGGEFIELSHGKGKQHNLQKLQPSTTYKFRLAAVNECGKGAYSPVVAFSTSGSPPTAPAPPILKEAFVNALHLCWQKRLHDEDFILQMNDKQTCHGFLPVYNGKDTEWFCQKLRRASEFRFRLGAQNEEGPSQWSEEVSYYTLPDRPAQPHKPSVKGKIHAHQFKVKWDVPHDTGGSEITAYVLEINSGSGYEVVYGGSDTEAVCDRLSPGTTYQVRVCCISAGGQSDYSDPCTVTTEALCPNKCDPPKILGKPRPNSVSLRWDHPDYNGGASIIEYELDVINPDMSRRAAYRGKEMECNVMDLHPGQTYSFILRAVNRIGPSPWSDELTVTSGSAPPDPPQAPEVIPKSPFLVFVQWKEPPSNGSPVTEYRLEIGSTDQDENFSSIFQGGLVSYDVKNLTPFTTYFFRVQACNNAGCSQFSPITATKTPASAPNVVATPKYTATPTSLLLTWSEPANNGADILFYNIEVGDRFFTTETATNQFLIENLVPDHHYKIKIQAVNAVGSGPMSSMIKASTLPMPPKAPRLECVGVGYNYLKLKWGEGKNVDFTRFVVEMYSARFKEFQCVYQGTSYTCKVNKLQELTTYKFRISAANDQAGQGEFSPVYEFQTCIASPTGIKPPKIVEVTQRSCGFEWQPCRMTNGDPIIYVLQIARTKEEFKQVYKGPDTKHIVSDLEPGVEYAARVLPIRQAPTAELPGSYSAPLNFTTLPLEQIIEPDVAATSSEMAVTTPLPARSSRRLLSWLSRTYTTNENDENEPLSDEPWALIYALGFTILAVLFAYMIEKLIDWR